MKLYVRTRKEGIVDFYNAIATQLGFPLDKVNYDCTKIEVSEARSLAIEDWYKEQFPGGDEWKYAFGMHWVCSGPRVNYDLQGDEVVIEDDFIIEVDSENEVVA